jgi:prolyl-tRNA editing enzyme YbaK/EbsC (Cys-tRNA(Pro) deacylase)
VTTDIARIALDPGAHVIASIDGLGVSYELMDCDPELADTAAFCERYGVRLEESGNCIVVASKKEPKQYAACLVLSHVRLDVNGTMRRLMGVRKLSFASADETSALTGMMIGGVTPFGLPSDLPIYIDQPVFDLETVVIGGGSRSQKLRVPPEALRALPGVEVIEGLSKLPS